MYFKYDEGKYIYTEQDKSMDPKSLMVKTVVGLDKKDYKASISLSKIV